jgi:hypothetical protein
MAGMDLSGNRAPKVSPQGRDETLDDHGLLTSPADTGRNRPELPPVGQSNALISRRSWHWGVLPETALK